MMRGILPDANSQQHDVILVTANRNPEGADSLEATIQEGNTPDSLAVFTLANVERIRRERRYAHEVSRLLT